MAPSSCEMVPYTTIGSVTGRANASHTAGFDEVSRKNSQQAYGPALLLGYTVGCDGAGSWPSITIKGVRL